ncbi:MAG: hypothetical protein M3069_27275 [Chloroflexota bacterium]|nr:hypothetical protein [Chloroflexota bacterium]
MTEQSEEHWSAPILHEAALAAAKTSPTTHVPRMITRREVAHRLHGHSPMGHFNNAVAVLITRAVGSMWAAYLFVLIALISLPQALNAFLSGDTVTGVAWLSQSFLQLVLLPILMVGQNVIAAAQDARAETDHETLSALQKINVQQLQILESLARMRQQA